MPVVPFTNRPSAPQQPKVDDPWLLMAAAQMDAQGRLMEPEYRDGKRLHGPQPNVSAAWPRAMWGGRSDVEVNNPELGPTQTELNSRLDDMERQRQKDRK